MRILSQTITIAAVELKRRMRSRSALITAFVAPLAMATVFGLMLDGTTSGSFTIGLVAQPGSGTAAEVVDGILDDASAQDADPVVFVPFLIQSEAEQAIEDGAIGAAVVIGGATLPGSPDLTVVVNPSSPVTGQVAQSVASSIATTIETGQAAPTPLIPLDIGGRELSASAFFGASMAILLLFFATGLAAQSILEDKQNRTLDRILAGPTNIWSVLLGKVIAVSTMAIAGFITVWLVTSLAFDAAWGSPLAVVTLIAFTIFALAGVATFVGGLASTPEQATALTAVVTFGLSLLGGNFTGPADTPAALRAIRGYTPNGRALEAFTEVSVDAATLGSLTSTMVALVLFGLVFGALGLVSIRRRLQQ